MKYKVNMQKTEEGFAIWDRGFLVVGHKARMKKKP